MNWGCSAPIERVQINPNTTVINNYSAVARASNKGSFFRHTFQEPVRLVPHTFNKEEADGWLAEGHKVVCRERLNSSGGQHIIVANPEVVNATPLVPLYTKYIKSRAEFRVHVFDGRVISWSRKIRNPATTPTNWDIRSHDNGFIFARNTEVRPSDEVLAAAVACVGQLGLVFGGVDVLMKRDGSAFILEVNTAPGIEGQTAQAYAEAVLQFISRET